MIPTDPQILDGTITIRPLDEITNPDGDATDLVVAARSATATARDGRSAPSQFTPSELFWAKVEGGDPAECWTWLGNTTANGYSRFSYGPRPQVKEMGHRFAYVDMIGPVPDGLQLDHLCRNRGCVNPWHLEPVTPRENLLRGNTAAAENARKTHCRHGHPFDEQNTYHLPGGGRGCRACRAAAARRYAARRAGRNGGICAIWQGFTA